MSRYISEGFPMHRVILGALPRRLVEFAAPFYKIAGTEGAPARFFASA